MQWSQSTKRLPCSWIWATKSQEKVLWFSTHCASCWPLLRIILIARSFSLHDCPKRSLVKSFVMFLLIHCLMTSYVFLTAFHEQYNLLLIYGIILIVNIVVASFGGDLIYRANLGLYVVCVILAFLFAYVIHRGGSLTAWDADIKTIKDERLTTFRHNNNVCFSWMPDVDRCFLCVNHIFLKFVKTHPQILSFFQQTCVLRVLIPKKHLSKSAVWPENKTNSLETLTTTSSVN